MSVQNNLRSSGGIFLVDIAHRYVIYVLHINPIFSRFGNPKVDHGRYSAEGGRVEGAREGASGIGHVRPCGTSGHECVDGLSWQAPSPKEGLSLWGARECAIDVV
jgi:hypothetical protein